MESSEESMPSTMAENKEEKSAPQESIPRWRRLFGGRPHDDDENEEETYRAKSTLGILSDKQTDEVPGKREPISGSSSNFILWKFADLWLFITI
jgi:hypothetical protein